MKSSTRIPLDQAIQESRLEEHWYYHVPQQWYLMRMELMSPKFMQIHREI